MKKFEIYAGMILLAVQISPVFAGSTIQGTVGINHTEMKDSDDFKVKQTDISLQYFLAPVEKKSHPWREASFLEHAPSLSVDIGQISAEDVYKADGPAFLFTGEYASKTNPVIAGLAYYNSQLKSDFAKQDNNGLAAELGVYLAEPLAVVALYSDLDSKYTVDSASYLNSKNKITTYGLSAKYVQEYASQQALSLVFTFTKTNNKEEGGDSVSSDSFDFDATYYINPKIGLSGMISLQNSDNDSDKGKLYAVGIDAFVTENLSLTAGYGSFKADNSSGTDDDRWTVGANWWF